MIVIRNKRADNLLLGHKAFLKNVLFNFCENHPLLQTHLST